MQVTVVEEIPERVVKLLSLLLLGAVGLLVVALVVGYVGPSAYETHTYSAYSCCVPPRDYPGCKPHAWNDTACTGVQLSQSNTKWTQTFPKFSALNKLWILEVTPHQNDTQPLKHKNLKVSVSLWGSDKPNREHSIVSKDIHESYLTCVRSDGRCSSYMLVDVQSLEYQYYHIEVSLPDSEGKPFVGDMVFSLLRYSRPYSEEELAVRSTFQVIALVLLFFFFLRMRKEKWSSWSFEHKALLALLIGLFFYNNPFFPFEFVVRGWALQFFGSILESTFLAGVLLYWLFLLDRFRDPEGKISLLVPKLVVVLFYWFFSISFIGWVRIRAGEDPVYGTRDNTMGLFAIFYLTSCLYGAIVLWLIILVALTVPIVASQRNTLLRFLYFGVPTLVCIMSVVIGIFTGSLGPFNRESVGFMYYTTMYNVYVWILLAGNWPVSFSSSASTNFERTSLLR
ncbi:hypothetical protein QOT17_012667 [Balamuthia mandrillaris]